MIFVLTQSTPHSGCVNSITVSLISNVPFIPNSVCNPKFSISGLANANHTDGMMDLTAQSGSCPDKGNAAYVFKSAQMSAGVPAFGTWSNGTRKCAGGDSAICTDSTGDRELLTIWSNERTVAGDSYSFTFDVTNPMVGAGTQLVPGQSSPTIHIESSLDGKNAGNELQTTSQDHYRYIDPNQSLLDCAVCMNILCIHTSTYVCINTPNYLA